MDSRTNSSVPSMLIPGVNGLPSRNLLNYDDQGCSPSVTPYHESEGYATSSTIHAGGSSDEDVPAAYCKWDRTGHIPTGSRPGRSIDINDLDRLSQAWRSISDSYAGREGLESDAARLIESQDPCTRARLAALFAEMTAASENILARLGVPSRKALDCAQNANDLRRIGIQLQELTSANTELTERCDSFLRLLPGLTQMHTKHTAYEERLARLERMAGSAGSGATTASSCEARPYGVGWR